MWLSPPSPWIGSAMKQAMSWRNRSNASLACASARSSACSTSPKWMAGTSMRGQQNRGNLSVLTGSVLVSESV